MTHATDPIDLPLVCDCGAVTGIALAVSPDTITRVVCMCDDCQAYAHALGRASRMLDAHGGTEVFLTQPARLHLLRGADRVACLRLTTGGLMRWYASCCGAPLANCLAMPGLPFVGVHAGFLDRSVDRDAALGPVHCRMQGRYGIGPLPEGARRRASLAVVVRSCLQVLLGFLRRQARPHPFFPDGRLPLALPEVLDPAERARPRPRCGPRPDRG